MAEKYLAKCDINGDGVVDGQDWQIFKRAYPSSPEKPNWDARCDFNGDGVVDGQDYQILQRNMGKRVTPLVPHACMIAFLFGSSFLSQAFPYLRMFRDAIMPRILIDGYYHTSYILLHALQVI